MVTDKPHRRRPSRRTLIVGAAGVVGLAAAGTVFGDWAGPSMGLFDADPSDDATKSSDKSGTGDNLIDGVKLIDKGFSPQPPRPGTDEPLLGMGARLRNTTDKALWISAAYFPVDDNGDRFSGGDGTTSFGYGAIPLPPKDTVGIGLLEETTLDVDDIADIVVQLHALDFDAKYQSGAQIIQAEVRELDYHSGDGPGVDLVTIEADNPGPATSKADYMVQFNDGDGKILGGWYADRAQWQDLEDQLPDGENEKYPKGSSTHTLPIWLPPDLKPAQVSLYLWAQP